MTEKKRLSFGKVFLAALLALVFVGLFKLIMVMVTVSSLSPKALEIKENTILQIDLDVLIGDVGYVSVDKGQLQITEKLGLKDILNAIENAKSDVNIKGIYINVTDVHAGMATVKEIRDALEDFQNSGKFIVAYNENYTKKSYYLASVAKEVYVYPSGIFDFLGLGTEVMFLKGALDKLDVEMQIIRGSNNKFKSAVEPLMYTEMSEANKEQTQKYLDALWGEMLNSISKSRGVSIDKLNEIADSAYIQKSAQAVDYKLADGVKYYDEILDILKTKSEQASIQDLELLSFKKYVKSLKPSVEELMIQKESNIALIMAEGSIVDGEGEMGEIGGNSMARLVREARLDSTIKAVVLRINSPGGSALASDVIWREIVLTKKVKPVVVSMGDVAASGGYYIACAADKIYAQPNTITGSIGVFGVIPFTGNLLKNKLGVTIDRVQTNEHSILSLNKKLSESELKIVQQGVDDIYFDFISKVGQGRGMTSAEVDSIGQGRVWAGSDAVNIGLVDEFGGVNTAILDAAKRVGINKDNIEIKVYTTIKSNDMLEMLSQLDGGEEDQDKAITINSKFETKLLDMYKYVRMLDKNQGIQARMPYIYWIE